MDEQLIKRIANEEILKYMSRKQFEISNIPIHRHNGTDTIKISEKDLILNDRMAPFLVLDTSETFTITNLIENISHVVFRGFAANNKTIAATERCIINGDAYFGNCFSFAGSGSTISAAGAIRVPFIQFSNAMFVDSATLANNRVSATNQYFAYATDETGTVMAALEIVWSTRNSITVTSTLAADWKIQGSIVIT